jgi:hypothetical protein
MTIRDQLARNPRHPNPPRATDFVRLPEGLEPVLVKQVLDTMLNQNVCIYAVTGGLTLEGDYTHAVVANIKFAVQFIAQAKLMLDSQ